MSNPFAVIGGVEFREGDWFTDHRQADRSPLVIATVLIGDEYGESILHIRSPLLEYQSMGLAAFTELVVEGVFEKIQKPKYYVGQTFRNRFTEKSLEIIDVPRLRNETNGEYLYYVLSFSSTFGYNHDIQTENEITNFYITEGVVEV